MFYNLKKSVIYALLSKSTSILGNFILLACIAYYMDPIEQGYYYTFLSVISLQGVVELGLSIVIRQKASSEAKNIIIKNKEIYGKEYSIDRLSSLLKLGLKSYFVLSLMFSFICYLFGLFLFDNDTSVNWEGYWYILILCSSVNFVVIPMIAFFEGIGYLEYIQKVRLNISIINIIISIILVVLNQSLLVPSIIFVLSTLLFLTYFAQSHSKIIKQLLAIKNNEFSLNWKKEILPLQTKIGVSWICGFFIFQLMNPLVFKSYGPEIAGQFGFSMTLAGLILSLGMIFPNMAMPKYSYYMSINEKEQAISLYKKINLISITMVVSLSILGFVLTLIIKEYNSIAFLSAIEEKIIDVRVFFIILIANVLRHVMGLHASFIRSQNKEKHMNQSIALALFMGVGAPLIAFDYSLEYLMCYYFSVMFFIGYIYSKVIINNYIKRL